MNYTVKYSIFHVVDEVLLNKPRDFVLCFGNVHVAATSELENYIS
jgi:hypothetical protein